MNFMPDAFVWYILILAGITGIGEYFQTTQKEISFFNLPKVFPLITSGDSFNKHPDFIHRKINILAYWLYGLARPNMVTMSHAVSDAQEEGNLSILFYLGKKCQVCGSRFWTSVFLMLSFCQKDKLYFNVVCSDKCKTLLELQYV
jgi:hypothetical protein